MQYYTPGPKKKYRNKNYYQPKQKTRRDNPFDLKEFLAGIVQNRIFWIAVVCAVAVAVVLIVLACAGVFVSENEPDSVDENVVVAENLPEAEDLTLEEMTDVTSQPDFEAFADVETLKFDSEGEAVKNLQTRLAELGYLSEDDIVGNYGKKTRIAVLNFQKHNNLQYDGIAGPETQAYIYWEEAEPYEFGFIDAAPTTLMSFEELVGDDGIRSIPEGFPADGTYKLIADIERGVMIVYSQDSTGTFTVPVRYMLCSIGEDLQAGTYSLGSRRVRFSEFASDGIFRQYWSQIADSSYITSVKYTRENASAYLTESYMSLGSRVKGNSIVLTVPDSRWIWYNVAPKSELVIREGADDDVATTEIRNQMVLPDAPADQITLTAGDIPNTDNWYISGVKKEVDFVQIEE